MYYTRLSTCHSIDKKKKKEGKGQQHFDRKNIFVYQYHIGPIGLFFV